MTVASPLTRSLPGERRHGSPAAQGFTILELLLTSVIGSLLFAVMASVIVSHIRTTSTSELGQRVRDDANRINYFIQTEASESSSVDPAPAAPSCSGAPAGAVPLFGLNVPINTGEADLATNVVRIVYYSAAGNLRRCGPAINTNGSLIYTGAPVDGIVSTNTTLTVLSGGSTCQGSVTDTRQVAYRLLFNDVTISGAPANVQPPCALARARSFFVSDPVQPAPP